MARTRYESESNLVYKCPECKALISAFTTKCPYHREAENKTKENNLSK